MSQSLKFPLLTHGQAVWILRHTGISGELGDAALNAMVKKLRLHGVPFDVNELKGERHDMAPYGFEHVIELCVAASLISDGLAFRHAVGLLTRHRKMLRKLYQEALLEADTGRGAPIEVTAQIGITMETTWASGLYLDFLAMRRNGVLSSSGPKLLSPWQALERNMGSYEGLHPSPLIPLSQLCERAFKLSGAVPEIKRGRPRPAKGH
jgi:hypothetical protein